MKYIAPRHLLKIIEILFCIPSIIDILNCVYHAPFISSFPTHPKMCNPYFQNHHTCNCYIFIWRLECYLTHGNNRRPNKGREPTSKISPGHVCNSIRHILISSGRSQRRAWMATMVLFSLYYPVLIIGHYTIIPRLLLSCYACL